MYQLITGTGIYLSIQKSVKEQNIKEQKTKEKSRNIFFTVGGIPLSFFISRGDNPNNAKFALLRCDTKERLTGLFQSGSGYSGDIKSDTGRHYFKLYPRRTSKGVVFDTQELEKALKQAGVINNGVDWLSNEFEALESDTDGITEGVSIST